MIIPGLPGEILQKLSNLMAGLKQSAGENLHSVILFGGTARGRYHPDSSDINLMLLLGEASMEHLSGIMPLLTSASLEIRFDPFIVSATEFSQAAKSFPTRFIEIRNHHLVLHGRNPLESLEIPRREALVRIEQELRNLQLRMRRRFVTSGGSDQLLGTYLRQIIVPLAVNLDALVEVVGRPEGMPLPTTRGQTLIEAGRLLGLNANTMVRLASMRGSESTEQPSQELVAKLFSEVLQTIGLAAEKAAVS